MRCFISTLRLLVAIVFSFTRGGQRRGHVCYRYSQALPLCSLTFSFTFCFCVNCHVFNLRSSEQRRMLKCLLTLCYTRRRFTTACIL